MLTFKVRKRVKFGLELFFVKLRALLVVLR